MFSMNPETYNLMLKNSFAIDFIEITLTPKRPGFPIYKGSGSVSQDNMGNLYLKLYHKLSQSMDLARLFAGDAPHGTPGKLVKEEDYFEFKARDLSGATWTSEILPIWNFAIPSVGTIINGNLDKIELVKKRDENLMGYPESVFMVIPGKYEIPCNKIQDISGEGWRTTKRNICMLNSNGITVRIQNEENYMLLQAFSDNGKLPEKFEWRLVEALSVLLGIQISPVCYERIYMETEKVVIQNKKHGLNEVRGIPAGHLYDLKTDSLAYFIWSYLQEFKKPYQPFFTYWCRIHSARQSGDMENTALIVCTSIEGIIKEYYHNTEHPVPRKILRQMAADGWFADKLVDEWIDMRNKSAHGERFFYGESNEQTQQNLDKLYSCVHIFNILLLRLIGFRGNYVNYSKEGWPVDYFPR